MAATETKTTDGIACPCPLCGATEGLVVRVADLTVECSECSEAVDRAALGAMIAAAQRLIRWLDLAADA